MIQIFSFTPLSSQRIPKIPIIRKQRIRLQPDGKDFPEHPLIEKKIHVSKGKYIQCILLKCQLCS